jgi:hypothetical protein
MARERMSRAWQTHGNNMAIAAWQTDAWLEQHGKNMNISTWKDQGKSMASACQYHDNCV